MSTIDPGVGRSSSGIRNGANTRARLAVLYGSAATLTLEPVPGGGTRATVSLPMRMRR